MTIFWCSDPKAEVLTVSATLGPTMGSRRAEVRAESARGLKAQRRLPSFAVVNRSQDFPSSGGAAMLESRRQSHHR
jgi:hypothetical protein